jgi:hypothetical protein
MEQADAAGAARVRGASAVRGQPTRWQGERWRRHGGGGVGAAVSTNLDVCVYVWPGLAELAESCAAAGASPVAVVVALVENRANILRH